jgi:hypothetical protein
MQSLNVVAALLLITGTALADQAPRRPPRAAPPPPEFSLAYLTHNGSVMQIQTWRPNAQNVSQFAISYVEPRPTLYGLVGPGTLLIDGIVDGSTFGISANARVFLAGCPPIPYPVNGWYDHQTGILTLTGPAPTYFAGCIPVPPYTLNANAYLQFTTLRQP